MVATETNTATTTEDVVVPLSDNWKSAPSTKQETSDPAIKEKDEQIKIEKPEVVKPDEPEKIPGATPKPIQDRPDEQKDLPEKKDEIKFANEESERVFNLIKEGRTDEVYSILGEQKRLKEVDKLQPADVIKLNLQYQNKDFSEEDINDLFNERYPFPEKPVQEYETDDEFSAKIAKYEKEVQKIEKAIKRDAKPATTELLKLQKEIVLPDINRTEPLIIEPTQEELEAQKVKAEKFLQSVNEGVQKFNGYETTFKDEEVEIKVGYKLTKEDKEQIQPLIALSNSDAATFLKNIGWLDENGNINTTKLTEDLPLILNKEKVLQKLVSETGNKRHEASIKSIKNINYSGSKNGNGEVGASPEELQNRMATHFFSQ